MKIDEKMSPRERLLLFSTLELLRKEIGPKFSDWKDADDWLFSQLDFTKDELRQIYEGRNVAYYDGSAIDFEAATKKRFDDLFIFDDEIHINDDFTSVNGYLWATDGLVDKLRVEVGPGKIDYEENINFYAVYDVVDKKLELTATYFSDVPNVEQKEIEIPLNEEEKEALFERFEAYSNKFHGRELSLYDLVNEVRGDSGMELLEVDGTYRRTLDETVEDMVENIRGIGIDQGSGYFELNTFEVDGEKFELVGEVFKDIDTDTKNPYYGIYYFVGHYDGDTLLSDYLHTKDLSLNEVKVVIKDLYERDFTEDVKKELEREGMSDNLLLAREEYEKYKEIWYLAHGVTADMISRMKDGYHHSVSEGAFKGSFEEYEQEFGYYGGEIYSSFNEFLENEFEEIHGEHLSLVNSSYIAVQLDGWWFAGCCPEMHKAMTVSVGFSHTENEYDKTEFCINSFDRQELNKLFEAFCEENHLRNVHIQSLEIVRTARTLDELVSLEEGENANLCSLEEKMAIAESKKQPEGKCDYKGIDISNKEM